jgi:transcriptional regulator with XRE-family HTH domain
MLFDLESIGLHVRAARLRGDVSQAGLARLAGVSRATVNALENGTLREIGVRRLSGIVAAADRLPAVHADMAGRANARSNVLELSFPYDWSNPDMNDDVLIRKVVERGLFEDIVRVSVHFGIDRVRPVVESFAAENLFAAPGIRRMMSNIVKALVHDR